jgi:hypothetical protein
MRAIGYWVSEENPNFPHPEKFVGAYSSQALKEKVFGYLRSGNVYVQWRGLSACRFECGVSPHEIGSKCLTDGFWLWPEGLAHYVSAHDVVLPEEFVVYMESCGWKVKHQEYDYNNPSKEHDFAFWLKYSEST